MTTPTPRTDEFLGTIERHEGCLAWSIKGIEALVEHAQQLERELSEAREHLKARTCKAILTNEGTLECSQAVGIAYNQLQTERDQLRKVVDKACKFLSSILPAPPFDARTEAEWLDAGSIIAEYNQLPHVLERKTK